MPDNTYIRLNYISSTSTAKTEYSWIEVDETGARLYRWWSGEVKSIHCFGCLETQNLSPLKVGENEIKACPSCAEKIKEALQCLNQF